MSTTLSSERLILRPWREDDLDALAQLCADPEVMAHFPATLDRAGSAALLGKLMAHQAEHGFTFWALQRREDAAFVGFTGLARVGFAAPFVPAVEIGWRLARPYWGQGYARGVRCSSPSRICSWMKWCLSPYRPTSVPGA